MGGFLGKAIGIVCDNARCLGAFEHLEVEVATIGGNLGEPWGNAEGLCLKGAW